MLNKILDSLPAGPAMFLGGLFFFMPIMPEPHLWEKAKMIAGGLPMKPIDWLDIVMHAGAGILALAVFVRTRQKARDGDAAQS